MGMSNAERPAGPGFLGGEMEDRGTRAKGLAIVSLGVLLITPDTLLVRLAAMEPWSLLVWRSFLVALGLFQAF